MINYIPLPSDPDYDRIKNKEKADEAAEQQQKTENGDAPSSSPLGQLYYRSYELTTIFNRP